MTDKTYPLLPVYEAAHAVIAYMDKNSGACTGQLLQALRNALVETDDLQIPEFLRRKKIAALPAADVFEPISAEGLEDLL